jgi:hypothetical protein
MYYEINVSRNGKHLFATAERSVTSNAELQAVYPVISKAFPVAEGFSVSVTKWERIGRFMRSTVITSDDL